MTIEITKEENESSFITEKMKDIVENQIKSEYIDL
jgi:hypothetical protein